MRDIFFYWPFSSCHAKRFGLTVTEVWASFPTSTFVLPHILAALDGESLTFNVQELAVASALCLVLVIHDPPLQTTKSKIFS